MGDSYSIKSIRDPYIDILVANIEAWFDDKSVMASFNIYNPANLPDLPDSPSKDELETFTEYSNQEIETLAHQFEDVAADSSEFLEEWSSLRQFMNESCGEIKHRDVVSKLCSDTSWTLIYPNMNIFAKICRVVLIETANVERTFSQLKTLKPDCEIERMKRFWTRFSE